LLRETPHGGPESRPTEVVRILLGALHRKEWEMNVAATARRILAEFEEMPGMTLTRRQACRLFGLDEQLARIVLDVLVDLAYLRETTSGKLTLGDRVAAGA
jgi:hypothetical protein